jgi:pimeloyl-ACP methyl ester carboxylesterase
MERLTTMLMLGWAAVFAINALAQPYQGAGILDPKIDFADIEVDGHNLHYAFSGSLDKPGVLFLHGTPGGWDAFEIYLSNPKLQRDFFMVSVDRLGWGASPLPGDLIDGKFELQARSFAAVMQQYPNKRWILIGHSLGASMAPKVALIEPERVDALFLLAGSLDPKLGKPRWYNRAANTWVVSRLIGKTMRYSNREIMGLRDELQTLSKEIADHRLDTRLVVMQGMKDRLVSPKNPSYVQQHWQSSFSEVEIIELAGEGHFLPWRQTPLVIETLYQLAKPQSLGD